jgi:hypothetical protein
MNYCEIYDNSSTILKFMKNSRKSITILENLWKIRRQLFDSCVDNQARYSQTRYTALTQKIDLVHQN